MEKEHKKLRKLIKKNYRSPFRDFLISIREFTLVGALILFLGVLSFLIISKPMILAMLLTFAIAFYIIKKLSETPMSKLSK